MLFSLIDLTSEGRLYLSARENPTFIPTISFHAIIFAMSENVFNRILDIVPKLRDQDMGKTSVIIFEHYGDSIILDASTEDSPIVSFVAIPV